MLKFILLATFGQASQSCKMQASSNLNDCMQKTFSYLDSGEITQRSNEEKGKCFTNALNAYGKCVAKISNDFDFSKIKCKNIGLRLYDCMRATKGKQQCLKNQADRTSECKKKKRLAKSSKRYDFSSTSCKNFGLNLYDCMREVKEKPKQQCLNSYYSRDRECKNFKSSGPKNSELPTELAPNPKKYDFTFDSCKKIGMLLYECMRAPFGAEKQACLSNHGKKTKMCELEGGRRLCL